MLDKLVFTGIIVLSSGAIYGIVVGAFYLRRWLKKRKGKFAEKTVKKQERQKNETPQIKIPYHRVIAGFFILCFLIGAVFIYIRTGNYLFAVSFFELIAGGFVWQAARRISADPPHRGILTIFGFKVSVEINEGLDIFPIYPFLCGVITVNVQKANIDFPLQTIFTPENAKSKAPLSLTFIPKNLMRFINAGRHKTVVNILHDMCRQALRYWAKSEDEGPSNYNELLATGDEGINFVYRAIIGEEKEKIPSSIPTSILIKLFRNFYGEKLFPHSERPRPDLTKFEKEKYKDWDRIDEIIGSPEECGLPLDINNERFKKLKVAVDERLKVISQLAKGNGIVEKEDLGITFNRVNLGDVQPEGKLAEVIDLPVKEEIEAKGETTEIELVKAAAKALADELKIPGETALDVVQSERGKAKREIKKIDVSAETLSRAFQLISTFKKGR